jgi:hypothetical protein
MTDPINNDNRYAIGSHITAKEAPTRKLIIRTYKQRIYYCNSLQEPASRELAYFEHELIDPL